MLFGLSLKVKLVIKELSRPRRTLRTKTSCLRTQRAEEKPSDGDFARESRPKPERLLMVTAEMLAGNKKPTLSGGLVAVSVFLV